MYKTNFAKLWYIELVISLSLGSSQYSGRGSHRDKLYYSTMPIKKQSSWEQIAYFEAIVWLFWLVPFNIANHPQPYITGKHLDTLAAVKIRIA